MTYIKAAMAFAMALACSCSMRIEPVPDPDSREAKASLYVKEGKKHLEQSEKEKSVIDQSVCRQLSRYFFESAMFWDPSNEDAPVELAKSYYRDGKRESTIKAEEILRKALMKRESTMGYNLLCFVRLNLLNTAGTPAERNERADDVLAITEVTIDWNPGNPWPYLARAEALGCLGKDDEASIQLNIAERLGDDDKEVRKAIEYRRKIMAVEWHTAKAMPKED